MSSNEELLSKIGEILSSGKEANEIIAELGNYLASIKPIDKTALVEAQLEAKKQTSDSYTPESWEAYMVAVIDAGLMPEDSQLDVDAKAAAFNNARGLLVTKVVLNREVLDLYLKRINTSNLNENDYTPESWNRLKTAMDLEEIDQAMIDHKATELSLAFMSLEKSLLNRVALNNAIQIANNKNASDYTPESWAAITTAIAMSENTQEEIDAKAQAIEAAVNALVLNSPSLDRTNLDNLLSTANNKNASDYTPESWATITTAIAMNENTQEEIDAKAQAMEAAINSLVLNSPGLDRSNLDDLISAIDARLSADDFTPDSWEALQVIVEEAKALVPTTQEEIDSKCQELSLAVNNLVEKTKSTEIDRTELESAIMDAEYRVEREYTLGSWSSFIVQYKAALKLPEHDQGSIDRKTGQIKMALSSLNKRKREVKKVQPWKEVWKDMSPKKIGWPKFLTLTGLAVAAMPATVPLAAGWIGVNLMKKVAPIKRTSKGMASFKNWLVNHKADNLLLSELEERNREDLVERRKMRMGMAA